MANFEQKLLDIMNGGALALMISAGHRTRLFDVLAAIGPTRPDELARNAELSERYVREWLGAMVTGGIVDLDPVQGIYSLPQEHAALLTRKSPSNFAVAMQWIAVLGGVEDDVVEAFRHGRGVPYSSYKNFHRVMAEESAQTVVGALEKHILPMVPGLISRLEQGIDVVDIGCGAGRAMIELARLFPKSRFVGLDFSEEAIAMARSEARAAGLGNVNFGVQDFGVWQPEPTFDLVTAFDVIHDQSKPQEALNAVAKALKPGGLFLMQDIAASSHVHENIDRAIGPFLYTISCFHCMSVSLANGGPGLGAAWGKQKALEMLKIAGFADVRVEQLPHDILNYYYVAPAPH